MARWQTTKGLAVRDITGPLGRTLLVFDADDKFIGVEHEQAVTKETSVRDTKDAQAAADVAEAAAEFKAAKPSGADEEVGAER